MTAPAYVCKDTAEADAVGRAVKNVKQDVCAHSQEANYSNHKQTGHNCCPVHPN